MAIKGDERDKGAKIVPLLPVIFDLLVRCVELRIWPRKPTVGLDATWAAA